MCNKCFNSQSLRRKSGTNLCYGTVLFSLAESQKTHSSLFASVDNVNDSSIGGGVLDLVFGFVKTKVAYQFSK